jgi:hypothetical protein
VQPGNDDHFYGFFIGYREHKNIKMSKKVNCVKEKKIKKEKVHAV